MKSAVVAGANGFLGSAIIKALIANGTKVTAIYHANSENIPAEATKMTATAFFDSKLHPDCIFLAIGNYANTHAELLAMNETLYQFVQQCPASRIIYISSTNVYGIHKETITEQSAYNNPALYALSKLSGEFIVSAAKSHAIMRLTYIYGPGISNSSFLPQVIKSAKTTGNITLFGNGARMQDYIYIDDAVALCLAAAGKNVNDMYLCATGKSVSNKEAAEIIAAQTGCTVTYTGEDTGQSFHFSPEISLAKLNYFPKMPFAEGLKKML